MNKHITIYAISMALLYLLAYLFTPAKFGYGDVMATILFGIIIYIIERVSNEQD